MVVALLPGLDDRSPDSRRARIHGLWWPKGEDAAKEFPALAIMMGIPSHRLLKGTEIHRLEWPASSPDLYAGAHGGEVRQHVAKAGNHFEFEGKEYMHRKEYYERADAAALAAMSADVE